MNSRFVVHDTPLQGLKLIQRKPLSDKRGFLERLFCTDELQLLMSDKRIQQINHTLTVGHGTVRGLHFQYPPYSESKFVSCLRGEVFDVAIDLRKDSSTFLNWHAEFLSDSNHKTMLIPDGFAHGFQALTDKSELLYFHTASYQPGAEGGLNAHDPRVDIRWPEAVTELSLRDAAHPFVTENFGGLVL